MDELTRMEDWLAPLFARLSDKERRRLALEVARDLRRQNAANIAAQRSPDGSAFEPRKNRLRDATGKIRNGKRGLEMFRKLRAARFLKAEATADEAVVGFAGRAARIARVHQFGETDQVSAGGATYDYPVRELLGITDSQVQQIRDAVLRHLTTK